MVELPSVAEIVITRFGGLSALARALGHKNPTTVQRWRKTGEIPLKHWSDVNRAAIDAGYLDITLGWLGQMHAQQEGRRAVTRERDPRPAAA